MKSIGWRVLLIVTAGLGLAQQARGQFDPMLGPYANRSAFYVSAMGGWQDALGSVETNQDSNNVNNPDIAFSLKPGYAIHVAGGSAMGPLRGEFEIGWMQSDIDKVNSITIPNLQTRSGDTSALSLMVNGYYDIYVNKRFSFFAGAGFGLSFLDASGSAASGAAVYNIDGSSTALAIQGMVGLDFAVTEKLHLTLGYRIWKAFNAEITYISTGGGTVVGVNTTESADYPFFQAIELGMRYEF